MNKKILNSPIAEISISNNFTGVTDKFDFKLKPSLIAKGGVGVFSTIGIKKGTFLDLFSGNDKTKLIPKRDLIGKLGEWCKYFGVETSRGTYLPSNVACMSIGWYLNHSKTPNAAAKKGKSGFYYATKDIKPDTEITINYYKLIL